MSILVNIASEFTGKKAFKEAETATQKLERQVNKLGKTLVGIFAVSQVVAFGKASVKAFSEDEAAAVRLSTAMDNLGLSFSKVLAADFIQDLERTSGIVDDKLRPAFQALLTTTGSLTKSQDLLNNAIQISRASGIDLATVAQDLANGYVGITRGLKKYNTGLTQAELKTKSFSDILGVLLTKSAGAADAYLGTTAYKLDVLKVAADNAKESIGAGLVDAFAKAAGGTSAQDAAKAFDAVAKSINGISSAIGSTIGFFTKLYKKLDDFTYNFDPIIGDSRAAKDNMAKVGSARQSTTGGAMARAKQQKDAEAAAAKRAKLTEKLLKDQIAAQKVLTAEQKKQAALKKAATLFDMDQIQVIAALKGKVSEEDRKRLELQLALMTGNLSEAEKLTKEIAVAQGLGIHLANYLASLPDAKNPFASWQAYLDKLEEQARRIATMPTGGGGGGAPSTNVPNTNPFPDLNASPNEINRERGNQYGSGNIGAQSVVVQIDGKTIANALLDQSMSAGQIAYLNRRTGGFD